ncbi:aminoglycoside phosphotransferase family protein [Bradyrhizobium sp. CCGB12]|uniref:aminoglycoside phosphotransferase family protein n=1 Tax=Bradyrhizobium sp. CCGB12 TaxID=2949632 RepID=UPI0020B3FD94|nr:aminoglycoside phosphotransferase family protein [Bradyrhizobium sp. CCGB12]MCP3391783.1 aminoglycoside phosphotransferase family protein [Bradyrhizobium sp. CCGB12]
MRSFLSPSQRTLFALRHAIGRTDRPTLRIDTGLASALSNSLEFGAIAVSFGTPGPHNKKTLLLLDSSDHGIAFAKLADRETTRRLLENEAHWLEKLAVAGSRDLRVPRLVALSEFDGGLILVQSSLSGKRPRGQPDLPHAAFLKGLHDLGRRTMPWCETRACTNIDQAFESCSRILPRTWVDRYSKVTDALRRELRRPFEAVPAHRDFVPWNTKLVDTELCVFDWEYATQDYPPAHDVFHYILLPRVLQRASLRGPNEVLKATSKFMNKFGLAEIAREALHLQLLAYLLDVCGLYIGSWEQWKEDRVVERYAGMIDQLLETMK